MVTLRSEMIPCGKNCSKCPHGPYWYAYWREGDKVRKKYLGKVILTEDQTSRIKNSSKETVIPVIADIKTEIAVEKKLKKLPEKGKFDLGSEGQKLLSEKHKLEIEREKQKKEGQEILSEKHILTQLDSLSTLDQDIKTLRTSRISLKAKRISKKPHITYSGLVKGHPFNKEQFSQLKRKGYLWYFQIDEEDEMTFWGESSGWRISPEGIEIAKGWKVPIYSEEMEQKEKELSKEIRRRKGAKEEIQASLTRHFHKFGDYPQSDTQIHLSGEKIEDPIFPPNIYGGGIWYVITDEKIWKVQNNGSDGDDWRLNNISTGGAGAIGRSVKKSAELEKIIREYTKK